MVRQNHSFVKMKYVLLLSMLCLAVFNVPANAFTAMETQGYKIQLYSDPDPLVAGKESLITFKILREKDQAPIVGEQITIKVNSINSDLNNNNLEKTGKTDIFGNYELKTIFETTGIYQINVALFFSGVNTEDKAISVSFPLTVNPKSNSGLRLTFVLILLLVITGTGIVLIKSKIRKPGTSGIDLLDIPIIKQILKSRYFQPLLQLILLFFLIIFIFLAFFDIQDSAKNLSVIVIWTIWWAGVIFTFVLAGRLWCFMCPVGAISEWMARIFEPHQTFPKNLQNMWLANTMFVLLTWLDIQIGVVRNPVVTGLLLTGVIIVAAGTGLFYQRRTFCRYMCPIGGLIGIYSLFSPIELRSKDLDVCKLHKRKDCYLGNNKGRGCPMFELIPKMDNNKACNFCGECIKSCPKNNISIRVRSFFKDAWASEQKSLDDAVFTVVLVGVAIFVTGDMLEPWSVWMESAMEWFPADFLGIRYNYTVEVLTKSFLFFLISIVFIPGLILIFASISNHMAGKGNYFSLKQTFITFGFMFIPVGLSMHLAHNIGHLLNESQMIIPALQRTINTYLPFNIGEPDWQMASVSLADPLLIYWMQMTLFLVFYGVSILTGYRLALKNYQNPETAFRALIPMVCIVAVLMAINVSLLNLPMAMRHIH